MTEQERIGMAIAVGIGVLLLLLPGQRNRLSLEDKPGSLVFAQSLGLTTQDEKDIQQIQSRGIYASWESACFHLAREAADSGDFNRSLRFTEALVDKSAIKPSLLFGALEFRLRIAIEARRFDVARSTLATVQQKFRNMRVPLSGYPLPTSLLAEITWWSGNAQLDEATGEIEEAIQACHDAGPAIRRAMKEVPLSEDQSLELESGLQLELREKKSTLYEKIGSYRMALSTLRDAIDYSKRPKVWDFKRAREGQMRQNWEKKSTELLPRYEAGGVLQQYLEAWRDQRYDVMFGLLSAQQQEVQPKAGFLKRMQDLTATGVLLVDIEKLHVDEITSTKARASVILKLSKEVPPDMVSGDHEVNVVRQGDLWRVEALSKTQKAQG